MKSLIFSLHYGESDEFKSSIIIPPEGLDNIAKIEGHDSFENIKNDFFDYIFLDKFLCKLERDEAVNLDVLTKIEEIDSGDDYRLAFRIADKKDALSAYDLVMKCKGRLSEWASMMLEVDNPMIAIQSVKKI